jgi:hypothetical protein
MLEITSLRVDERVTPKGNLFSEDVPFLCVNATFRITEDEPLFERTKAETREFSRVLTVDDPERYWNWLVRPDGWNFSSKYEGYGRAWIHNDAVFNYLEKFQTFHFREFVADSTVTRSIITELEFFKHNGRLPSVYRHAEEYVVISHFHCLDRMWD